MKYVMVTNWDNHWNKLHNNRTLFTLGMVRWDINKIKPVENTDTLFIKKHRITREILGCWAGKVYDFKKEMYKDKEAISFGVKLKEIVSCPVGYLDYSEGWYCEADGAPEENIPIDKEQDTWKDIQEDFDISKREFGKRINFVKNQFKRSVIFRDVEQAYILAKNGFNKPAVILAGGVIEELLRVFLDSKNENAKNKRFEELIEICQEKGFLKEEISNLASAIRQFRNSVHLSAEMNKKYTISKATASATVALIFTIVNDFQKE